MNFTNCYSLRKSLLVAFYESNKTIKSSNNGYNLKYLERAPKFRQLKLLMTEDPASTG